MSASLRFDVTTMAAEPPGRFRELVAAAEEAGFDALWVCDSSLHARDVYVYLTLVAAGSSRLRFGPNCTNPYTRHPAVTANAITTLQEVSGGRAQLAVGTGDRPVTELGYRPAPVATVREMVRVIRALHEGETVTAADGIALRNAHLAAPVPVPVYLAASGPRMLELGGEIADGVLFFSGVHPPAVEYALERIRAGAARAGRRLDDLDVACTVAGSLRDDAALARSECVPLAAWFPQTAPVTARLAGVPDEVGARIRAAYAGGHFDAARQAFGHVTGEMIDRFTVAGGADLWVRRIQELLERGIRHVNIFLAGADRLGMVRALGERVLPRLRS